MIRINLLPVKAEVRRQYGKQQLLLAFLLVIGELTGLYVYHGLQKEELDSLKGDARAIQSELDALERQTEEAEQLRGQRTELEQFADVLAGLEANRSGPVRVLEEIKEMLNAPANDLQRVAQERRGWNTTWDPRTAWVTSFVEEDGALLLEGKAMTNDDVAELLVRLASSPYFTSVQLEQTSATTEAGLGAVFSFKINARVSYSAAQGG